MANIKTLKDLTPGTVFDAGPIDVRVLDHMTNGTTLLIADKAVAWRPFSLEPLKTRPEEAPTPYPNDFSLSYLKDELNGPFLAAFDTAGGPIRSANIVEANWSLADHRGGFGYGGAGFLKFHHTVYQAKIGQVFFYFLGSHYFSPLK